MQIYHKPYKTYSKTFAHLTSQRRSFYRKKACNMDSPTESHDNDKNRTNMTGAKYCNATVDR